MKRLDLQLEAAQKQIVAYQNPLRKANGGGMRLDRDLRVWASRSSGACSAICLLNILQSLGSKQRILRSQRRGGVAHCLVARMHLLQLQVQGTRGWQVVIIRADAFLY